MAELTEEEIARAIYKSMGFSYEARTVGARGPYGAWAEAISHARAVLALVQPAIDAAVAAERERCAKVAESCGDTWSGSRCVEQAAQEAAADDKAAEIAAAIRSRSQESETGSGS